MSWKVYIHVHSSSEKCKIIYCTTKIYILEGRRCSLPTFWTSSLNPGVVRRTVDREVFGTRGLDRGDEKTPQRPRTTPGFMVGMYMPGGGKRFLPALRTCAINPGVVRRTVDREVFGPHGMNRGDEKTPQRPRTTPGFIVRMYIPEMIIPSKQYKK